MKHPHTMLCSPAASSTRRSASNSVNDSAADSSATDAEINEVNRKTPEEVEADVANVLGSPPKMLSYGSKSKLKQPSTISGRSANSSLLTPSNNHASESSVKKEKRVSFVEEEAEQEETRHNETDKLPEKKPEQGVHDLPQPTVLLRKKINTPNSSPEDS